MIKYLLLILLLAGCGHGSSPNSGPTTTNYASTPTTQVPFVLGYQVVKNANGDTDISCSLSANNINFTEPLTPAIGNNDCVIFANLSSTNVLWFTIAQYPDGSIKADDGFGHTVTLVQQ
jgi:hypothetical protein